MYTGLISRLQLENLASSAVTRHLWSQSGCWIQGTPCGHHFPQL